MESSVVGFGGMCGGIGGMLMLLVAGGMLQWLGNFTPLFVFAGVMHPLAWIAIWALVGNIAQIDLDKGPWTAQSPALIAMGLGNHRRRCLPERGYPDRISAVNPAAFRPHAPHQTAPSCP